MSQRSKTIAEQVSEKYVHTCNNKIRTETENVKILTLNYLRSAGSVNKHK